MGDDKESDLKRRPGMKPGGHVPKRSDLAHNEAKKQSAAMYIHDTLGPATNTAGSVADADTELISGNPQSPTTSRGKLHGWEVWAGVRHRLTSWREHHKHLTQSLTYEYEALLDVNKILSGIDVQVSTSMDVSKPRAKSQLDDL
ncbi:hypothetical protein MMF93_11830 [Streptomyces tubbatahanensis]|uniref:Transposase n=1 Tax=Streptomyces tubbatahanensis TaxID=2923272 RepID=A0ABY3XRP2_9ACTN|nr:hypothetical protein [Streptomyces tubbatahanensis]UNS97123.1 hypothetical protein MMF93_11830 [Streptomyces tubbatahanensis]